MTEYSNADFLRRMDYQRQKGRGRYLTDTEIKNLAALEQKTFCYMNKKKVVASTAAALSKDLKRWL